VTIPTREAMSNKPIAISIWRIIFESSSAPESSLDVFTWAEEVVLGNISHPVNVVIIKRETTNKIMMECENFLFLLSAIEYQPRIYLCCMISLSIFTDCST
jgi:hypothetical protein